ncbi:unnamed protein product [Rotaria sordida]|uniref:Glucosamine/galactosamine-6-phosphate isomerase domain-containing protein n=1 Tax=Rotaria sordida TaxID=392033 RepID=A0A814KU05_9BILA|nr:unnamed protein product [Rotaria sordida]
MAYTDTSAYGGKNSSEPPSQRVTLTVNTINEAKYKIAVVIYASKSPIVTEILEDNNKTCPIGQLNLLLGISMEQLY